MSTAKELRQSFARFRDLPAHLDDAARAQLATALTEEGARLGIKGPAAPIFTAGVNGDVIICVVSDHDGAGFLMRVPADKVDAQLGADLDRIHRRVFAGGADLEPEQWDAALRVMSALGLEMDSAEDMASWGNDEGSSLSADDLAPLWLRWQGCDLRSWAQLAEAPSRVCAFNRAM
jgi:hypothetical protein